MAKTSMKIKQQRAPSSLQESILVVESVDVHMLI